MRSISALSVDCRSSEPPPAFPCRPCPTIRKRSRDSQRRGHIGELSSSIAWLCLLRSRARVITVIRQSTYLNTASTLFVSSACAQTAPSHLSIDRFTNFIAEASTRFTIPARWIRAIIQIESAGDEHAISPRGAMGLMQLMPGTWVELSVRYKLGLDPFDPRDNILAGTAYLREMHDRFGSAGFLAAYHAGPVRYEQHLATGQPLPPETTA
jgi:soluble lytic murein transglycosylase-like protein